MKQHLNKLKEHMGTLKSHKTPLLTLAVGLLLGYLVTSSGFLPNNKNVSPDKAKALASAYLATLPLESSKVNTVTEDGDVYKVELNVNGQDYTSYMTKDGRMLFQAGIDLTKTDTTATNQASAEPQPAKDLPKTDKPNVELFVMSHCPYGTQIEKGILPVVDTLGDKIDFTVKFVDYAMHGEKEVTEQLNQYCIQKDMGKKVYLSYLKCFLEDGDSARCLKSNNINANTLKGCTAKVDSEFKIMANFNDKSTWNYNFPPFNTSKEDNVKYSVQGSPTLIINGVEARSGRDSASLLASVCSAFNNQPEACNTKLESASPVPGFGSGTTDSSAPAAQCN